MNDTFYIAVDSSGKATSRRSHLYEDCSTLHENSAGTVKTIGSAEMALLGLKICTVCVKRQSGGPAIDALEGFFGEDWPGDPEMPDSISLGLASGPREMAWKLFDYLRDHGYYLASRRKAEVSE